MFDKKCLQSIMNCWLILITCISSTALCQLNTKEQCCENVKNELDKVLQSYRNPPNFTVPDEFTDIKKLINKTNLIVSKIKKSDQLKKKLDNVEDNINKTRDELQLIKKGEKLLEKIQENLNKLKEEQNLETKTQDECSKAKEKFKILNKDFEELKKQNNTIKQTFEYIVLNINKINEKSLQIKRKVEDVKVPTDLSDAYMCETFKNMIGTSDKIKNLLQQIRDNIRSNLKDFIKKLKTDEFEKLEDIKITKKELKQDIKKITKHLEKAIRLKELVDTKNQIKKDLENIKKLAYHLLTNGVCDLKQGVIVEN
ncbi:unnamed protein product [Psylliodes chrysocephalus]|uniref:Uncharacterized protein n=1 Tax=Psylliodes chrysocephalus TaxID=3402493 RepID=A0A9P0G5V9_9CUCU|nr:unnamed protein product [Psylliodes chrysocephala]